MSHSRASDVTIAAILLLLAALFSGSWAQAQSDYHPHLTGVPALMLDGEPDLARMPGSTRSYEGAPGDSRGAPESGGSRDHLTVPYTWGLRLGYSGSGAVGSGPGTGSQWGGGAIGFDWTPLDTPVLTLRARVNMAVGEGGLNYLAIDAPLVRIRIPLDSTDALWLAFAPLDLDVRGTTDCRGGSCDSTTSLTRNRFGWMPAVGIDGIFRVGGTNRVPCHNRPAGSPRTDICNPREAGHADGACVIRIGARAGAAIGYQETQDDEAVQFLTGAEARASCSSFVVDLSSIFLVSGDGAHASRTTLDIFGRFAVGSFDIGPYLTAQASYEMGSVSRALTDPSRYDRTFFQFDTGLRFAWDVDRGLVVNP